MLWVLWIGHGVEELVVAREAADIFGWALSGDLGQSGIELARDGIGDPADFDPVFPVVAKVRHDHKVCNGSKSEVRDPSAQRLKYAGKPTFSAERRLCGGERT